MLLILNHHYKTLRLFALMTLSLVVIPTSTFGYLTNNDSTQANRLNVGDSNEKAPSSLDDLKVKGISQSRYASDEILSTLQLQQEPEPKLEEFQQHILPILNAACVDCHGPDVQEGNIRIDSLDPNLLSGGDVDWWNEVFSVVTKGEMPPPDTNALSDKDRTEVVHWLSSELQTAALVRRAKKSNSAFRRMTRYEYNYALQDLLGLPWDFAKDLPPDPNSEDGFQNSSALLHMSVGQFETYHRLSRAALMRATLHGERPPLLQWDVPMPALSKFEWQKLESQVEEIKQKYPSDPEKEALELAQLEQSFKRPHPRTYFLDINSGRTAPATWEYYGAKYSVAPVSKLPPMPPAGSSQQVVILPGAHNNWLNIELGDQLPDEGMLRVQVRASIANPPPASEKTSKPTSIPSLQLMFGWQASNEGRALLLVSKQDTPIAAPPNAPEIYRWEIPLGEIYPRNSVRKISPMGEMPSPSEYIRLVNSSVSDTPIQIDHIQIEAPVFAEWPPESYLRVFNANKNSDDELTYAREILNSFMQKAWRRPIDEPELQKKLALFSRIRGECESFQDAIVEVLASVLSAPQFLYLSQSRVPTESITTLTDPAANASSSSPTDAQRDFLSPYELATRLSIFLWCSLPDEELLALAKNKSLNSPEVIRQQVERMLADPRSKRLSNHFVRQWLNLELLDFVNLSEHVGNFDLLRTDMRQEPVEFFDEILRKDQSVLNFIHADFAVLNERLANHYGISGVDGNHFRRTHLNGDLRRGGLLTQASQLTMNSDYPDSHPLKRGVWLLNSILNDPPPPPPPAVPQIDLANPEIAQMTLKERIEDHRNQAACMNCHIKIDPWGIAFENYDSLGRWREDVGGKAIDASSELPNNQTLDGIEGLKRFLLEHRQDQFIQAMTHKMTTYALGRPLQFEDSVDIDLITHKVRKQGDGLATLIQEITASELFRSK